MSTDSPAPAPVAGRQRELDALRALCMLYIVGYFHVQPFWVSVMPLSLTTMLARIVLALFCFISGHLLASRYRLDEPGAVRTFYVRRILRIYPLYFIALSAFLALKLIPASAYLPGVFLLHVYLQKPLRTLWFVSLIVFLYALMPLYLRRPSPRKTLLLTVSLYLPALLVRPYASGYLVAFALGIFLAQQPAAKDFFLRPRAATLAISSLLVFGMGVFVVQKQVGETGIWQQLFGVSYFVAAVPFSMALSGLTIKVVPGKLIFLISQASFALYLTHRIVYALATMLYYPPRHTVTSQLYLLCVLLPAAILVAHGVQIGYDRAMEKLFPAGPRCSTS